MPRTSPNHPLSKRQKAALAQAAKVAWEMSGAKRDSEIEAAAADPFGMAGAESPRFTAWRRQEQLKAVGIDSLTKCQQRHYRAIIQHFVSLKNGQPAAVPPAGEDWPHGDEPANLWSEDRGAQLRKIGKLLGSLNRPWEYGHDMAARMAKVDRLDWCNSRQLRLIILALEKDNQRHDRQ